MIKNCNNIWLLIHSGLKICPFQVLIDEYTDDVIELLINEILDPQTGTHFYVFGTNYNVQYALFAPIKFVRSWDFARRQPFQLNP